MKLINCSNNGWMDEKPDRHGETNTYPQVVCEGGYWQNVQNYHDKITLDDSNFLKIEQINQSKTTRCTGFCIHKIPNPQTLKKNEQS